LRQAFYCQDILTSTRNPERKFTSSLFTARTRPSEVQLSWMWYWHVLLEPTVMQGLCCLLSLLSFTLVWSEVTFFSEDPLLSLYAWLIQRTNLTYSAAQVRVYIDNDHEGRHLKERGKKKRQLTFYRLYPY
jgi:hypothetical protein